MSSSPADAAQETQLQRYGDSWGELMKAVRNGTSWSGHERNRCLLNFSGKEFADASSVSGLDFDDDGRGLAVTDWNRDGKLDLWLRNRSAPRLRLMLNQDAAGGFLALRLQGDSCNRDGIGAVVEVDCGSKPLIRSVKAGEMFLSQSSKWLHFGLGSEEEIRAITVSWPGGKEETFQGARAGGRYLLRQGSGTARLAEQPALVKIAPSPNPPFPPAQPTASTRYPVAVPLPSLAYRDPAAQPKNLQAIGQPQLLFLWESSCDLCERDLRLLESRKEDFAQAGVSVLALAADPLETLADTYERIDETGFSGRWGLCEAPSLQALWKWQSAWFERKSSPTVPFAILMDGQGRGMARYQGNIDVDAVLKDARELVGIDARQRWHLAPPLQGSWFTNPLDMPFIRGAIQAEMQAAD